MDEHAKYTLTFLDVSEAVAGSYKNTTPVFAIGDLDIYIADVIAAAVLSQSATYLMGTKGEGKTLLAEIVMRRVMADDALYLRGDKDLALKDLMIRLNLDGKTEEEIFQVSDNLRRPFFLVDELNRCLGLMQNQFLNIADGYIEIRGKKYYLGKDEDYSLMFATGNPPREGDYTGVFDEDIALLDRIGLILNVDDYPIQEMDTADITKARISKRGIPPGDMREEVFGASKFLSRVSEDFLEILEVLSAFVYSRMLKLKIGKGELSKRQVSNWRKLITGGSHAKGDVLAYASDISQRSIQEFKLAEALMVYYAGIKMGESMRDQDLLSTKVLVDCYLETLMLKMRYDRRFLPVDYIEEKHYGNVQEFLRKVKESLGNEIDPGVLEECAGTHMDAKECIADGRIHDVQRMITDLKKRGNPLAETTQRILSQRMKRKVFDDRRRVAREKLRLKV